ncbi:MAG: SDR family oxidoreductase [Actinomycetota bacterium]
MSDAGFDLSGRRAVVTGASTGIGAAVATRLAAAGAEVVAVSRSGRLPAANFEATGRPAPITALAADLADPEELDGVIEAAVARLGGLDILVNNAGRGEWQPLADLERARFDALIELNLWAPLRLCQLAAPHLAAGREPAVVMIGSIDAIRPSAGGVVYGATKAALAAATVALSKEWMGDGIRINQVDPGLIDTPMAADVVASVRSDGAQINLAGRVGEPEEIAGLVHYLVAPVGRFANGAAFRVDGGALALGPFDLR